MGKAKRHSLLVVDDEPDMVLTIKALLRSEYNVLGATRASEGLRILEQEQVHIVMSDQRMPEMTGIEFLSRLRELYPDTVRLLFTGYADLQTVVDAINQGNVYRYVTKPWQQHELHEVLRQAAEHYDLIAERKRLLTELEEKNKQLEAANEELQNANNLKKAFIKVASHELRTPLTIVLGLADLARTTEGLTSPFDQWMERIYQGSQRLNERVDLMIKLLEADIYERPLKRTDVDLGEMLQSASRDIQTFVDRRSQTLELNVPPDLGILRAEQEKLRDCVIQLLLNAIKFTPDGGTIRMNASRSQDTVEIRVTDTGLGIDPASLGRIFDPFFTRFDVSKHCSGVYEFDRRGLGLGLSVVKAFVEMHGGRVKVDSKLYEGSTFSMILPTTTKNDLREDDEPEYTHDFGAGI
ncbi:MAG: ATP-binding protein [Gemmataceae bacterium]